MEYINVMAEDKYLVVFVSLNLEKVQSICYIRGEKKHLHYASIKYLIKPLRR